MIQNLVEISKLFIPLIALIGLYIAWQQFQANKTKVRLDLYDKRFKIYDNVISVLDGILSTSYDLSEEDYRRFMTAVNEAEFLLPDKVVKVLLKTKKVVHLIRIKQRSLNRISSSEREDLVAKSQAIRDSLEALEGELEDLAPEIASVFKRVIKFEKF